ncbi:MAG TPA: 2-oxoglutarate dehydrogenase E1 component, partial [Pseudomonadales bacterium]|nr:2-oxoglutarate dehydrogenase E1 component [Pseudomonadales bacterium]
LQQLAAEVCKVPEGVVVQKQVDKIIDDRRKMIAGALPLNWGFAETMAYATLLTEGHPVRLMGQDSGRGTFSHRHAVIHNQKDGSPHVPLANIPGVTARFTLHDSLLSEEAALAFEYGYATTNPRALVIWEAQFGDFVNGAQVVIDQFIASGETKWGRLCGLVMFLPHGYEGQGPEHSSARLERFMQLCAEHNIQVCIPTTPAQIFHLLRRQMLRPLRKPLIVMTPKSLLRHKLAISSLEDLAEGEFKLVIPESAPLDASQVRRIVLCSGKVYYDLIEAREAAQREDVAVIRIEQFYPFPHEQLQQAMAPFIQAQQVIWCQEEPMNQGVWYSSQHHMSHVLGLLNPGWKLDYVGREASAAPATGYLSLHVEQQQRLVKEALGLDRFNDLH